MNPIYLQTPMAKKDLASLRCGDHVMLSGILYTARDAAHKRLCEVLAAGERLPVELQGQTIFYAGPTPPPPGRVIGAIGPTTSARMDVYTPPLLRYGVRALIGKGARSDAVRDAIRDAGAVYFAAIGGCAAYLAGCVTACQTVAYGDLGTESVKRLVIRELPLTVAVDAQGNDFYVIAMQPAADHAASWMKSSSIPF
ncbi:MAG: FumA C-terminus/TtdB family hydratase beta subunit [Clostridia bacterium]|nr:FumA C-terminus/TtdB family hydratase beta subunit [Clostridia bacterium]